MAKRNGEVSGMRDACAGGKLEDVQDEMQQVISKQSIEKSDLEGHQVTLHTQKSSIGQSGTFEPTQSTCC